MRAPRRAVDGDSSERERRSASVRASGKRSRCKRNRCRAAQPQRQAVGQQIKEVSPCLLVPCHGNILERVHIRNGGQNEDRWKRTAAAPKEISLSQPDSRQKLKRGRPQTDHVQSAVARRSDDRVEISTLQSDEYLIEVPRLWSVDAGDQKRVESEIPGVVS